MIVTILILIALLVLVAIVGVTRFIYSFGSSQKNTMQSDIKTKALDLFIYLGIGISLVVSVTNLLQVVFAAINRKFIDTLNYSNNYVDASSSDVRFAIASLIVMFPIYVGLSWYVSRDIQKFHFKQDIAIRKILIYCTLFITILTLIGTLVSLIYTYLGGELTIRFGLKALAVFTVALAVFAYYFYSLKRDYAKKTIWPAIITVFASVLVVGAVVWSITIIGTPKDMRAKKIDSTRLSDISRIQQEVFNRFQSTDKLPLTLGELDNAFQGYAVPTDPLTKESYVYKVVQQPVVKMNYTTNRKEVTTPAIFELCATFDTVREYDARGQVISKGEGLGIDSQYSASNYYYDGDQSPFWNHGVGETCFKRIISSDMYYGR